MLPYIEQKNVDRHLDRKVGVYAPANLTARLVVINTLPLPLGSAATGRAAASPFTNYAGCHHDVEAPIAANNTGVFFLNSSVRYEDITDGTSSTIFIGEKTVGGRRPRLGVRDPGHPQEHGDADRRILAGSRARRPRRVPSRERSRARTRREEDAAKGAPPKPDPVGGFSSYHPGGANFLFGDGSVRFLKQTINTTTYRHLANRADGEMISGSDY